MSKTTAFKKTPSQTGGDKQSEQSTNSVDTDANFAASTLSMAWQLLFVVILPVLGGALLDNSLDTSPVLVLIGSVVALAGTIIVIRRGVSELNWEMRNKDSGNNDDK